MSTGLDFVRGSTATPSRSKSRNRLSLCYAYPELTPAEESNSVIATIGSKNLRKLSGINELTEDGLYAGSAQPLTKTVVKPYQLNRSKANNARPKTCCRHLEIAIREVRIDSREQNAAVDVKSVALLYKRKVICRSPSPFNSQLYKLLLRDPPDSANLSIQVQMRDRSSGVLPLPLPKHSVSNSKIEIDFSISTADGVLHSGTVVCTFSLAIEGHQPSRGASMDFYVPSEDPNDPRNATFMRRSKLEREIREVKYFLLDHPALRFDSGEIKPRRRSDGRPEPKEVDNVIIEHASFTLGQMSLRHLFQSRHPLRPSSSTHSQKLRGAKKQFLVVTVLRGVEVPIREESALVQPLLEIEWGDTVHETTTADGSVPIWHQTFRFEAPEQSEDQSIKLRLYDQHPVWGLQWLGEASIPMEVHHDYQELERWVGLSPLSSPVLSLGYVQPSPGHSYTRLYVLMKMEQPGNQRPTDNSSLDSLARAIQRCTIVPYKVENVDDPVDASRLAMLLPSLPLSYGPLTPKQALSLNKVDHFGRAAFLATLLRGLGLQSSVILGSSQTRKCAAYVLTTEENSEATIWDPENGDHYTPGDTRCSLTKVYRLINHQNIWENTQQNIRSVSFKHDMKLSRDWRPIGRTNDAGDSRPTETLELNNCILRGDSEEDFGKRIEEHLKAKISEWRSADCMTTTWNRHAVTMLRGFLPKFNDLRNGQPDKKELKQLCRAYYTHGFIVNLRHSSLAELAEQVMSTKIHKTFGPIEFALACHVQRYIGNAHSLWLGIVVMRSRE
ncbi:coiled-coil and C2 domain-containing protein 2A-like [Neodiprion lecontei]|uniref:Coiled-coil and C2 domain-containing protein 2A-like n=1 Tax=Neodiprion lecontei TaxID=441921 RepID=A0A6J0BAD6_NEOLC|nr:coiled-coil and C2 domain-containing protein 2A-like [Neodiprion lecontei]